MSGSEDEEYDEKTRTLEDVRRHDEETLAAEEEAEKLLGGGGGETGEKSFSQRFSDRRDARRQRRRESRREKRSSRRGGKEGRELLYDTETGGRSSSEDSSETDMQQLKETQARQKVCTFLKCGEDNATLCDANIAAVKQNITLRPVHRDTCSNNHCFPRLPLWRIPGNIYKPNQHTSTCSPDTLKRHTHLRANDSSPLTRRLPSGLPYSQPYSNTQCLHP